MRYLTIKFNVRVKCIYRQTVANGLFVSLPHSPDPSSKGKGHLETSLYDGRHRFAQSRDNRWQGISSVAVKQEVPVKMYRAVCLTTAAPPP